MAVTTGSAVQVKSIEHMLFKEVLASVGRLRFAIDGVDHRLRIVGSSIERQLDGTRHRSDVHLQFESEPASEPQLKWDGQVHVEVLHAHPVEPDKHDTIRAPGHPMVEIAIPQPLRYRFGGEATTDQRERDYVRWLRTLLESDRGFLRCTVLSDPSSAAYLDKQPRAAQRALQERDMQLQSAALDLHTLGDALQKQTERIDVLEGEAASAREDAIAAEAALRASKAEIAAAAQRELT